MVAAFSVLFVTTGIAAASPDAPPSPNAPGGPSLRADAAAIAAGEAGRLVRIVTPCRLLDTHKKGGPIRAGTVRKVTVVGKCGIPGSATAIIASVTTTASTSNGYLTGYPTGTTRPKARFATYLKGQAMTVGATLPLRIGQEPSLSIFSSGRTHVIIDVTGYYEEQIHAVLAPSGGIFNGTPRVVSSTHLGTGSYQVAIDRDTTGCTPIASVHGNAYFASSYESGGFIYANTYAPNGTPTDLYWSLTVLC